MEVVAVVAVLVALCAVVFVVSQPLRRGPEAMERQSSERVRDLEAAREAKYQEIRDAELDARLGKLTPEDHRALDRQLRAEAIEILRELDELEASALGRRFCVESANARVVGPGPPKRAERADACTRLSRVCTRFSRSSRCSSRSA